MAGNVYEWCWDWYDEVSTDVATDPCGAVPGDYRVCRGGAYNFNAFYCAVSYRNNEFPYPKNSIFGFRVVRSIQ